MRTAHYPGCSLRHTRRQWCNGPAAEAARVERAEEARPEAHKAHRPAASIHNEDVRVRAWNGALATPPRQKTHRLYFLVADPWTRVALYALAALIITVATLPQWYMGIVTVVIIAIMFELMTWATEWVSFWPRGLNVKRRKRPAIVIDYADIHEVRLYGSHRVALRYWYKPEWASSEVLGRADLTMADAQAFTLDLQRAVDQTTTGPPIELIRER